MGIVTYPFVFDGISIPDVVNGFSVLSSDPYKMPRRDLIISDIARTSKSKVNSAFYKEKLITVSCSITRATRALAEQSFDSLMVLLQGLEKAMIINQSGDTRRYTCTLQDCQFTVSGGSYLEFDLIFECSDRFGYDIATKLLLQITNFTSGQKTDTIQIEGSAPWQVPIFTLTYSVVTTGTNKAVRIGNGSTGQVVVITRNWVAGDVLIINTLTGSVTVNGVEVLAIGALPEFAQGVGYVTYSDDFTARTFSMTVNYNRRWV